MQIQRGHLKSTVTGLVSEHVGKVMLGNGWLTEHGAVWDFVNNRISINGTYHPFITKRDEQDWCRRVVQQSVKTSPARTERHVMTKIVFLGRVEAGTPSTKGRTEPKSISTGFYEA